MRITMLLLPLALASATLAANPFSLPSSALNAANRAVDETVRMQLRPAPMQLDPFKFSRQQDKEIKSEHRAKASPIASEPAQEAVINQPAK